MKYTIEVSGDGGEIVLGTVSKESYDFFVGNEINIEEWASVYDIDDLDTEVEIPEELQPFDLGDWHDCDSIAHEWGPFLADMFVTVTDETGNVLYENIGHQAIVNAGAEISSSDEICVDDQPKGTVVFIGQNVERGLFFSAQIDTDSFDIRRLTINTTQVEEWELVSSLEYNGEELVDEGMTSTDAKSFDADWHIVGEDE
jgi:hypothetical protein